MAGAAADRPAACLQICMEFRISNLYFRVLCVYVYRGSDVQVEEFPDLFFFFSVGESSRLAGSGQPGNAVLGLGLGLLVSLTVTATAGQQGPNESSRLAPVDGIAQSGISVDVFHSSRDRIARPEPESSSCRHEIAQSRAAGSTGRVSAGWLWRWGRLFAWQTAPPWMHT